MSNSIEEAGGKKEIMVEAEGKRDRSLLDVFKSKEEVKEEVEKEAKETKTEESLLDKAKNYVAEKIANVPTPEASLIDVDFLKVSFDSADYLAKVNVKNPYSHSIPICEIDYTLKSIGSVIASGRIPDPGSLKASRDTLIDVPVKVPHSIIITLVKDIATDWDIDYELELGLIIDIPIVGNITIPLSRKGEIKLPTLKDVIFGTNEEQKDSKEKEKEKDSKEKDKDSD
ncbi:PREDICTED: desiccation protectant protein Lea14 homolog [Fragaria vesca subsp. vesca]|uniref:desiccation protectant protein Lea14 homolog n=1 Tax=Fragaria vesca subsp. vesca TaxID=101020 RepID=UPI0002C37000|nr:PREDICTED: desiccation protectant protein Lea14 homolog [Fragaria vesca subsp. vesca]